MQYYQNNGGDSGIIVYEVNDTSITVQFSDGWKYLYTYESVGSSNIEEMKRLATEGRGLNGYINRNVKHEYENKWR